MNEVLIRLMADDYRHLINILGDLPNRSNTYGLIVNIEQQFKAQFDAQNAKSSESEVIESEIKED